MISRLQIANYKSIESLNIETRRVNVFIGEPNSGKSNLLEALAMFSQGVAARFRKLFRCRHAADLFYDNDIQRAVRVCADSFAYELAYDSEYDPEDSDLPGPFFWTFEHPKGEEFLRLGKWGGGNSNLENVKWPDGWNSPFLYYVYKMDELIKGSENPQYGRLLPPYGGNLSALVYSNKLLRDSVAALFKSVGYRLEVRPQESEVLMLKEVGNVTFSYYLESISETLRRIVFYKAVLETNTDAILILDEPEANTFPFYTKYLAERIALDESNQFFLSTHNPYVLMSIIEKTPKDSLAVYVTRMRNYRTEVHRLSEAELGEALELSMDIFFNLDRYFPE